MTTKARTLQKNGKLALLSSFIRIKGTAITGKGFHCRPTLQGLQQNPPQKKNQPPVEKVLLEEQS
ncbi:hypothetical protein CHS0354_021615 [Potamilus streckersoni]|uniref:Uncharacterized protein n=1 Tax=Potamilus streckersoni TaxID=2493646 RepID=A0AAE0W077_9BIVA|nr:hypothetical protein CHS0354_021615 [Potamilus streckersoni]